jgi:hypothetical protein
MSTLIGCISVSHANGEPEDMDPDTIGGYDDTWLPLRLLVASSGARFFFRTRPCQSDLAVGRRAAGLV